MGGLRRISQEPAHTPGGTGICRSEFPVADRLDGDPARNQHCPAGDKALLGSYLGYDKPYATSHADLDEDLDLHEETRNAMRTLVEAVRLLRRGELKQPDRKLRETRPK